MATPSRPPAAIVIAGGRSSRFGSDKLLAHVHGRTVLDGTMTAVAGCRPVVLVSGTSAVLPDGVITVSEHPRWGGPAAAIAAGVAALPEGVDETLIVAADLAYPEAAVAALLGIVSGVLADADGRAQWLLARVPAAALRDRIARMEAEGGAAGRPAHAILGELSLPLVTATAEAIADIDVPHDLDRMKEPPMTSEAPRTPERPRTPEQPMTPEELDAWAGAAARRLGVTLEPGDVSALLDLAKDAAHGVTRPAAPLTAYIAGLAVAGGRTLEDVSRELRVAISEGAAPETPTEA